MAEQHALPGERATLTTLLRRGWPVVVVAAVVGVGAGALVTGLQSKRYTAAASVLVTPTGVEDSATLANGRTAGTINLDTEARLVKSTDVARQVKRLDSSTKSVSLPRLISAVSVTVPANTQILTIHYVASSPAVAARRANDFASAYLIQRQLDAQATLGAQIKNTRAELTTATSRLESVATTLGRLPATSAQRNFVQAQRALIIGQISGLTSIMTRLSTTAVTPGKVLTKAATPTSPSEPSPTLNLSSGFAAGLLIGLVIAWLRFTIRHRLRTPGDVVARLRIPVLETIGPSGGTGIVPKEGSAYRSYRRLSNVLIASVTSPGVVVITGAGNPTAISAVATNLARSLEESGVPTKLAGRTPADTSAGSLVDLPAAAVRSRPRIDAIRGDCLLIVSAPDGDQSVDAQAVAMACDALLIVIEAHVKADATERLLETLDSVGGPVLGAVLVPNARWWIRVGRRESELVDEPDEETLSDPHESEVAAGKPSASPP